MGHAKEEGGRTGESLRAENSDHSGNRTRRPPRISGLTEVAEASVESGIAETSAVRPMAASVVGAVALLVALLAVETLGTAWERRTRCNNQKDTGGQIPAQKQGNAGCSPSWHRSPLTPGGQRQLPVTGSQLAPFLHLQWKEQFLPKNPSEHAKRKKTKQT